MKVYPIQKCSKCGYVSNPITATVCHNCNHPLNNKVKTKNPLLIPWSAVPLVGLLLLTLVLYFSWRKYRSPITGINPSVTLDNQGRSQPSNAVTSASDLQLYNELRDVPNVPQGLYLYGGAMASAALRSKSVLGELASAHPEFRLRYTDPLNIAPDSGMGINMVINGELSFAESFRPLKNSEYNLAKLRGFTLKQIPVALGGIAFYSHPSVKLAGLSINQMQKIFSGKLTNWQQLGGSNLPIVPISQDPDAKASTSFLLQGLPSSQRHFGRNVQFVRDTTAAIRKVASTPGAIGYGSQAIVVGQRTIHLLGLAKGESKNYVQPITPYGTVNKQALLDGTYPLTRRIFVVIREDGELDELAGRAYVNMLLSNEGQKLVDQAGYLPIR
jgi:phosphate transport system substrate-binding protein